MLEPERLTTLEAPPLCETVPEPLMTLETDVFPLRLKMSPPLLTMLPDPMEPVDPLPTRRLPALMIVPPE